MPVARCPVVYLCWLYQAKNVRQTDTWRPFHSDSNHNLKKMGGGGYPRNSYWTNKRAQLDAMCPAEDIFIFIFYSCPGWKYSNANLVSHRGRKPMSRSLQWDSDYKVKVTYLPLPSSCAPGFLLISPRTTLPSSSWRSQTRSQTSLRTSAAYS